MKSRFAYCVLAAALLSSYARAELQATPGARWLSKANAEGLPELQVRTYRELAKLHTCKFPQITEWEHIFAFSPEEANPMAALRKLGLDALPFLSEALDDATPTNTITRSRDHVRIWKVNDLVVLLIREISDREFVIGEWGPGASMIDVREKPELAPAFQKLVQDWYAQNKGKSVEERKMSDLQSNLRNRLDSLIWLGEHRSRNAAPLIVARIEGILGGKKVSSSTHEELAEASLALGRIGAPSALPAVRKACEHLSYRFYMSHRPLEQGRAGNHSGKNQQLFKTYEGLALLGEKGEAVDHLRLLLEKYGGEMESASRKEYERLLSGTEKWKDPLSKPDAGDGK